MDSYFVLVRTHQHSIAVGQRYDSKAELLSAAARTLADRWTTMSESQIVSAFLFGAPFPSLKQNGDLFFFMFCPLKVNLWDFIGMFISVRSTCWFLFSPFVCLSVFLFLFFSLLFLVSEPIFNAICKWLQFSKWALSMSTVTLRTSFANKHV